MQPFFTRAFAISRIICRTLSSIFIGLSFPTWASADGEFTPIAGNGSPFSQVHFFPKNGNRILINGKTEIIPPGIGVMSGGVIGTYNDASIDKQEHQKLKGKTLYYVYAYMNKMQSGKPSQMKLDFSQTGHNENPTYGNEVHANDPGRSLVGMVYTTKEGKFLGNNRSQLTLSWFNRGHTAIAQSLDGSTTTSQKAVEVNRLYRLEWLQWGINNSFRQGFTVPNIYVAGTVVNSKPGSYVQVSIGINGTTPVSYNGTYYQTDANSVGFASAAVTGANGANEGYNYATFLMSTAGGEGQAMMKYGAMYSSPLDS
jgi:hypothetical protein